MTDKKKIVIGSRGSKLSLAYSNHVKNLLLNPDSLIYKFLDFKNTASLIKDHLEGRENRRLLIWSLLNLENWNQIYGNDPKIKRLMNQSEK